jgi:hypothetical protein
VHVACKWARGMYVRFWWESPVERTRRRWEDNNKIDLRGTGWGGMDWNDLAQDVDQWKALVSTVMSLRIP